MLINGDWRRDKVLVEMVVILAFFFVKSCTVSNIHKKNKLWCPYCFCSNITFLTSKTKYISHKVFFEHGICFIIYVLIIISTYFKKPLKNVFWEEEKNSNLRSIWEGKLWETRMKWNKLKGLAKERLWRDFFLYNIYFLNLDELLFLLE